MQEVKLDKILCSCGNADTSNEIKYFNQFNIYKNVQLPCEEITEKNVDSTVGELFIKSAKIINTIIGCSVEGQRLTGKKLIVVGNVDTKTIFKCVKDSKEFCVVQKNIPFSTYIVIPNDICLDKVINLRYCIEDITTAIIEANKLFISVTLILQYIDGN